LATTGESSWVFLCSVAHCSVPSVSHLKSACSRVRSLSWNHIHLKPYPLGMEVGQRGTRRSPLAGSVDGISPRKG
jgi:hypothetical protein